MTPDGIGRFFHHGWEIAPGEDSLLARMASYHEFGHMALNSTTAWGGLLQHLAIAHTITGEAATARVLNAAVAAARHAHEVYATLVSISVFGSLAAGAEQLLLAAQPGYARFLTMAKKIGPSPDDAERWADWDGLGEIRRAAVTACMLSPAVLRLLEDGTERFRLSSVSSRDWPDRRLRTLTRLAPHLWAARQPSADSDQRVHDAIDAAAEALRDAGHPTLSRDEYRELLPELTAELNRLAAGTDRAIELNLDGHTGVPGLFGAEAVRVRAPLPATVGELLDIDVNRLVTGTAAGRHLYLCSRRMRTLRSQFALRSDPGLPDEAPVCAIVTPTVRAGQVNGLRLTVLPRPELIGQLDVAAPIISGVSLDCLRDEAWRAGWLDSLRARTRVVGLFDLPVEPMILAWLGTGEALHIGRLDSTITGRLETALAFRLTDEEPVLLPVTQASAHALLTYTERAAKTGPIRLDEPADSPAHIVLDHLLTEDAVRASGPQPPSR